MDYSYYFCFPCWNCAEELQKLGILGLPEEELGKLNLWVPTTKIFVGKNEGFKVDFPSTSINLKKLKKPKNYKNKFQKIRG